MSTSESDNRLENDDDQPPPVKILTKEINSTKVTSLNCALMPTAATNVNATTIQVQTQAQSIPAQAQTQLALQPAQVQSSNNASIGRFNNSNDSLNDQEVEV